METTFAAAWLNATFAGIDQPVLSALHGLAQAAAWFFTPLFEIVSLLGEKGACFFALAVVLMLFERTRWTGVCLFVALCIGALMTNIVLKDLVARPRPFETAMLHADWWRFVGSPFEDGFSFPSGHVTAASAAMVAWMLMHRTVGAVAAGSTVVVLMCGARCYLMAHYPTDVLAGCLVGAMAAFAAFALTRAARRRWLRYRMKTTMPHS